MESIISIKIDSNLRNLNKKLLEKKILSITEDLTKKIQERIILKKVSFGRYDVRHFYKNYGGLFTNMIISSFIKRGFIKPENSYVNVIKTSQTSFYVDLELQTKDNKFKKEDFLKLKSDRKIGYLMKLIGGLDRSSLSQIFDKSINDSKTV